MSNTKKSPAAGGVERRKYRRTIIQESFSLFIVIPKSQGMSRIYLRDLSKAGLCFKAEESNSFFAGDEFELRFYTSPAFFLTLNAKVIRAAKDEVALEFLDPNCKAAQAIGKLQEFIELAIDA